MNPTGFAHYYQYSPYTFTLNATITHVQDLGDTLAIVLDKTIFRPAGGGQAADKGRLVSTLGKGEVIHLEEKDGTTIHQVRMSEGKFDVGDSVACMLDSERRLALMRAHTGEHILARALQQRNTVKPIKVHIEADQGTIITPRIDLSWEALIEAETEANIRIKSGEGIVVEYYASVEEAKRHLGDTTRIGIKGEVDTVRIVRIGGYDASACTGTHTMNSREIGRLKILNMTHSKTETCIEFATADRAFEAAKDIYNGMWPIGQQLTTGLQKLPEKVKRLSLEASESHQRVKKLESLLIPGQATLLKNGAVDQAGTRWISAVLPYGDVKYAFRLINAVEDLLGEQPGSAWLIMLGVMEDGAQLVIKTTLSPERWHPVLSTWANGRGRITPEFAIIPLDSSDLETAFQAIRGAIFPAKS